MQLVEMLIFIEWPYQSCIPSFHPSPHSGIRDCSAVPIGRWELWILPPPMKPRAGPSWLPGETSLNICHVTPAVANWLRCLSIRRGSVAVAQERAAAPDRPLARNRAVQLQVIFFKRNPEFVTGVLGSLSLHETLQPIAYLAIRQPCVERYKPNWHLRSLRMPNSRLDGRIGQSPRPHTISDCQPGCRSHRHTEPH